MARNWGPHVSHAVPDNVLSPFFQEVLLPPVNTHPRPVNAFSFWEQRLWLALNTDDPNPTIRHLVQRLETVAVATGTPVRWLVPRTATYLATGESDRLVGFMTGRTHDLCLAGHGPG